MRFIITGNPPSNNIYYRHARGRNFISKKGKVYKESARWQLQNQMMIRKYNITDKPLTVQIIAFLNSCKRRDIDNITKAVFDSMQGVVFENDNQIQRLYIAKKFIKKGDDRLLIRVKELNNV
jgi:crossover junction endodeoxyribonuclease RusA